MTDIWPKCLMPISGIPLLEIWLHTLNHEKVGGTLINLHHHPEIVKEFLRRPHLRNSIRTVFEEKLLGTAGTLVKNEILFRNKTTLLIHADNWCRCDFADFIDFHFNRRPTGTLMTMMTFSTAKPRSCGIVETDKQGVVTNFHEKVPNPPGNLANAAVYLIEPEVLDWMKSREDVTDFSLDVLPTLMGKIAAWHNADVLRDVGTREDLAKSQKDKLPDDFRSVTDDWSKWFSGHQIHDLVSRL